MSNGVRLIFLLLIPSAVLMGVLAEPITRLVYERGVFGSGATDLVSEAMVWWAISLPFQGVSLLFSRTFFSLQRTWATIGPMALNMSLNAALAAALYKPLGIGGIVLGTVVGTIAMCALQGHMLRGSLGGIEGRRTALAVARMLVAAAPLAGVAYGAWYGLDDLLGGGLGGQLVAVGAGLGLGVAAYAGAAWLLRIPEARQFRSLLPGSRSPSSG